MAANKSTMERLASLEAWADARSNEMQRLKGSVSALQKENIDMKTDLAILREENQNLKKINESLTEKVDSLERRVAYSSGQAIPTSSPVVVKLEGLETTAAALMKEIHVMKAENQEIKTLGRKIEKLEVLETTVAALVKGIPLMQTNNQEIKTLGRKNEVDALQERTKAIEKKMVDVHHSITHIQVKTREGYVVTDQWIPLDTRVVGYGDDGIGGLWDGYRGRVVVRRDGRYGVGARWRQEGKGAVVVSVKWAGSCSSGVRRLGRTSVDCDTACGMTVVELKEGDEMCLEACRRNGSAGIEWCCMFCWLL